MQLQVHIRKPANAATWATRAGTWSEPMSADPTVEFFVAADLPRQWTTVERNLYDDVHALLGWDSARITEFYVSPWESSSAQFREAPSPA